MTEPGYQVLEHTADVGIRACGRDLPEALRFVVLGMFALILPPEHVRPLQRWPLHVSGDDPELLVFNLLDELLYHHHTGRRLVRDVLELKVEPAAEAAGAWQATGVLIGETLDPRRQRIAVEIKAVTMHGLRVEPGPCGWQVQVIFDL